MDTSNNNFPHHKVSWETCKVRRKRDIISSRKQNALFATIIRMNAATSRYFPVLAGILFAFAHTQSPLYYSNQNQYLLHAAAKAHVGYLAEDWLANTDDPTPVFSTLAAWCLQFLGTWTFQVLFFLVLVGYFLVLWRIAERTWGIRSPIALAAGLILLHAGIIRYASDRLFGADYPWFLQCGVANQYVLGPGIQPSVVGVLLLVSLAVYAGGKPLLAASLAAGANLIHSTYLFPSAMLISGFMVNEWWQGRGKSAIHLAIIATLAVLPAIIYILSTFSPTNATTFAEAQRIIAEVRIPHHAVPSRWYDEATGFQIIWMILGLVAAYRTVLFTPLLIAASLGLIGTLLVLTTDQPTLSLLFPWRISAILIPFSTVLILTRLFNLSFSERCWFKWVSMFLIAGSVLGGIAVYVWKLGYREPIAEDPALEFVARTAKSKECYLIPAKLPKPSNQRGVYSATFAPAPNPTQPVFFEMARFRLATRAPLYIDFKSIPYKDIEVLEWLRRIHQCEKWFQLHDWDYTGVTTEIIAEGITHVVVPIQVEIHSSRLKQLFEGGAYRVYRIE
jgi:hypothetical protein